MTPTSTSSVMALGEESTMTLTGEELAVLLSGAQVELNIKREELEG